MAVEVGIAYVSIVPEMNGFARLLQQQVTGPSQRIGQDAGGVAGDGFNSRMGGVLKGGLAAVGIAAAAVLTKGFMDALDQGAIAGRIQAQLGTTPEEAARYGKAAGQLYASGVTDSVDEAARAISAVMRSGILPPDATNAQIESITERVADLSRTFELDLGQTSNAVGQMIKTGLVEDGAEALDILTSGMQQLGPRADDLADTFNEYSTIFRALGLDAETSMGLISQGMLAGARDTDVVADAIKEFTIEAVAGSDRVADGFEMVGLNADEMFAMIGEGGPAAQQAFSMTLDALREIEDPTEQAAAATELFGTKAEDLQAALYALDPSTAVEGLGDTAGAAERMGDALRDNAQSRIVQFKRGLEVGLSNFLGNQVIPALESGASAITGTFGPALSSGAGFVRDFFGEFTGSAGGQAASAFGGTLRDLASGARDELAPGLRELSDIARSTFLPAFQGVAGVMTDRVFPATMTLYSALYSSVVPIFTELARIATEVVWPAVTRVATAIAENLQPVLSAAADFITDRVAPAVSGIGDELQTVVEKARPVIDVVTSMVSWLVELGTSILGFLMPIVIRLAGPIFSGLVSSIRASIRWIGNIIGWIGDAMSAFADMGRSVRDFVTGGIDKFRDFIDWVGDLPGEIVDAAGDFGSMLYGKGKDIVRGLLDGVTSMGSWLADQLKKFATDWIPGPIASVLGIRSPSRVMADRVGRWIPAGIAEGIDQGQPELDARIRAMVTVPRLPSLRPVAALPGGIHDAGLHERIAELISELRDERRDIVLRVGSQEIARAVDAGRRQIDRR
ncbi:phage tail tape measure protein [Streptomyces harbinensis]